MKGDDLYAAILVGCRVGLRQAFGDRAHFRLGTLYRDPVFQASENDQRVIVACQLPSREIKGHPQVIGAAAAKQIEICGKNTDDCERLIVDIDGSSNEIRIAAKTMYPDAVTQYNYVISRGQLVFVAEGPAV